MFVFISNMKVSFKGVNNIYVNQDKWQRMPFAVPLTNGQEYNTTADLEHINLKCELDDDIEKDLNEFYVALAKCKNGRKFTSKANSYDSVNLSFNEVTVKLPGGKENFRSIKLNNEELAIEDDSIMHLFSFLALLTKRIYNIENIDPTPKEWVKQLHLAIHKRACDYLDVDV